ncbi:dioxygenase beta subunit domain protein [Mycobacterium kansasii]|uniref:Dioxygenase beta subunit domain protein n=1 Tax=Mycobacterium kansasii TaxID=1768 RepID=A0A1V3W9J9_MYCKA|nr:dioxygenase beta subunit domain protein [Mycobacterium kansasii]
MIDEQLDARFFDIVSAAAAGGFRLRVDGGEDESPIHRENHRHQGGMPAGVIVASPPTRMRERGLRANSPPAQPKGPLLRGSGRSPRKPRRRGYRYVMPAETQIANLLYRYAECIDPDLDERCALEHARIRIDRTATTPSMRRALRSGSPLIVLYPDGHPEPSMWSPIRSSRSTGSRHRSGRSYYTVLQQTETFRCSHCCGRYHDCFECSRHLAFFLPRLTLIDMVGDISHHLS